MLSTYVMFYVIILATIYELSDYSSYLCVCHLLTLVIKNDRSFVCNIIKMEVIVCTYNCNGMLVLKYFPCLANERIHWCFPTMTKIRQVHSNFCFNYNVSGEISNIMVIDLHAQP